MFYSNETFEPNGNTVDMTFRPLELQKKNFCLGQGQAKATIIYRPFVFCQICWTKRMQMAKVQYIYVWNDVCYHLSGIFLFGTICIRFSQYLEPQKNSRSSNYCPKCLFFKNEGIFFYFILMSKKATPHDIFQFI